MMRHNIVVEAIMNRMLLVVDRFPWEALLVCYLVYNLVIVGHSMFENNLFAFV